MNAEMAEQPERWSRFNVESLAAPSSGVVGRRREMLTLAKAFERGTRFVLVAGAAGIGKTVFIMSFADLAVYQFYRRIRFAHPDRSELLNQLRKPPDPEVIGEPSLFVIDRGGGWDGELVGVAGHFLRAHPSRRILGTSRLVVSVFPQSQETLLLGGFSDAEFYDFLSRRLGAVDHALARRLFAELEGHPLATSRVADVLRNGRATWDGVFEGLQNFDQSGLVGPDGEPISAGSSAESRIIVDISNVNAELLERVRKEPLLLRELSPRRFEELVAEILERYGYDITLTPPSRDGGFDLYAASRGALGRFLFLVECKRYVPPHRVGVEVVRSLHGVVRQKGATAGAIVTTSFFSRDAAEFQQQIEHEMTFHDYLALQKWLKDLPKARLS